MARCYAPPVDEPMTDDPAVTLPFSSIEFPREGCEPDFLTGDDDTVMEFSIMSVPLLEA